MQEKDANRLLEKFRAGQCTEEEKIRLRNWFHTLNLEVPTDLSEDELEDIGKDMWANLNAQTKPPKRLWPRYSIAAAAAILIMLTAGTFYLYNHSKPAQPSLLTAENRLPMNKGVILTTSNGKKIVLGQQNVIKTNDGSTITQSGDRLSYGSAETEVTHTLTNNTGHKYTLNLADGTDVYLDAVSSITYPTAFKNKERKVSITGQVYFKVKHDQQMPFSVTVKDEVIEDIGTEFNINAYDDETAIKTTLIEGKVKVNRNQVTILLKPGEQAVESGKGIMKETADLEATTAWLQGKLIFDNETLESLMNRVARIYDVKLVWMDETTRQLRFGGSLNYSKKLSTVLNYFRKIGNGQVDFLVEGKTIKIFKKK